MQRSDNHIYADADPFSVALDLPPPQRKLGRRAMASDLLLPPTMSKKRARKKAKSEVSADALVQAARRDFKDRERARREKQGERASSDD